MAKQYISRETLFNFGYWLTILSDAGELKLGKINQEYMTALIAALIDRGVNTPKLIIRWLGLNHAPKDIELVESTLELYEGSDHFKYLWQVSKGGRYHLLFDFAPYRYDIMKRVDELTTLKDVLL